MRIAFVTTEYPSESQNFDGGLANYLQRAGLALAELGHKPLILVPSHEESIIHDRGIEIHRINMPRWTMYEMFNRTTLFRLHMSAMIARFSWRLVRHIHRLDRQERIDIIQYPHLHALALLRSARIPAVCRLSGWGPLWRRSGDAQGNVLQVHQQFLLERLALRRVDAIYGPSFTIARYVEATIARKVSVIENPFVLDTITYDDRIWRERIGCRKYLLFVGQLLKLKGLATIRDIVYPLLARHPDLHLVFAGNDVAKKRDGTSVMEEVVSSAGEFRDRIICLGRLRHESLYPVVANAHAVWLPSLVDNIPNACLEAMAHGRVVIGTRGASFEQLIDDGVSGLLCEPGDAKGLMEATEKALALTDDQRRTIGEKARLRIGRMHPRQACAVLIEFYRTIIKAHRRSHA